MLKERKWAIMAGRKSTKPAVKATEAAEVEAIEPKAEEIKTEEIAEPKKAEAKKSPVKKAAKNTGAEAAKVEEPKAEEPKAKTKKAPAKAAAKKAVQTCALHIQYGGKAYSQEDLMKIAKDVWKYDLKRKAGELDSVELYVKPEENKVYYVMNGEFTGSFDI